MLQVIKKKKEKKASGSITIMRHSYTKSRNENSIAD